MNKLFFAASAASLAVFTAAAAQAEIHELRMVSTTLPYETQDLANPAGAKKMLSRIERAALRLCVSNSPAASPTGRLAMACRRPAVSRAVTSLAAPMVTAAYQGGRIDVATR